MVITTNTHGSLSLLAGERLGGGKDIASPFTLPPSLTLPRKGGGEWRERPPPILSVGIRPCSGALIVLVFALSQGIFWAGVASTFVMALGTAMTVAVLAALAVGAKGLASKLARGHDRRASQVMLGLELAAALLITLLGAVLFVGNGCRLTFRALSAGRAVCARRLAARLSSGQAAPRARRHACAPG